jgi:hypothetical protein
MRHTPSLVAAIPLALFLALGLNAPKTHAEPTFIDLTPVANTSFQDDASANNNQGGWSDEGPNDMYIFPPVEFGVVTKNAHRFTLPKPATDLSPTLVMLRGADRGKDKPERVDIKVGNIKGKYVYLLMNGVGNVKGQPKNYTAATLTVTYADNSTTDVPLREGIELRGWWTGNWYDNSGAAAWPFFMGRNLYSMKWRQFVGVWAMQWANPTPEKPITSIRMTSAGKMTPVLWAATIDDENYRADEVAVKSDYKRPADVPEGYFDHKLEQERAGQYQAAIKFELIKGVRRVDVIRPDMLAVTVDGAIGQLGAGDGRARLDPLTVPKTFTVTAADNTTIIPERVVRHSYETWMGNLPGYAGSTLYWHTFYLKLPSPLKNSSKYTVTVAGIDKTLNDRAELPSASLAVTPVIKVNQVAYSSAASKRYAYLGWWAAELGAVDYSQFKTFQVIDSVQKTSESTPVHEGPITLRKAGDELSGEDVYEMDLSSLKPGSYHIIVPGLGKSSTFSVGGPAVKSLYYDTARAFYHQRCGIALTKPFTEFERPICHTHVYESGYVVGNRDYLPKPNEATKQFRGGYHDAADDDVFTYHLRATGQSLEGFSRAKGKLSDGDLNIPESGNKIPDVLDEADWALRWYMEAQQPDGAIPLGRGNDEDHIRNKYRGDKPRPAFGVLPPMNTSSTEFAAVAAMYARIVRPFDAKRADDYVSAARKALAWALTAPIDTKENPQDKAALLFQAWAAAELFETTGDAQYNELFLKLHREGFTLKKVEWNIVQSVPMSVWSYATSQRPEADKTVQAEIRKYLLTGADNLVKRTNENPYRMGHDGRGLGWGNGNGSSYADLALRAYWLTGDQKYLDAASLNADFLLGANPISRTFITSVGARFPMQPQISPTLYTMSQKRGQTARGITNYGLADSMPPGWPNKTPKWRRVRDIGGGAEVSSEFTITETIGCSAMLFETLWSLEK